MTKLIPSIKEALQLIYSSIKYEVQDRGVLLYLKLSIGNGKDSIYS